MFLALLTLLPGCQPESPQHPNTVSKFMITPDQPESELIQKIIQTGDTAAYNNLSTAYLDHAHGDFLVWALLIANKYDYPQAYFDVFVQLSELSPDSNSIDMLDNKTQSMAIEYLRRATDKGHHQAPEILRQFY